MTDQDPAQRLIARYKEEIRTIHEDAERVEFYDQLASEADRFGLSALKHCFDGLALVFRGQYDAARKLLLAATKLDSNLAIPWNGIGNFYCDQKKYTEAINAYELAINLDHSYSIPWNNKGIALHELGRFEEAIQAYENAIQLDNKDPAPWNNKGIALAELGRSEDAIEAYENAIQRDNKDPKPWNNKGNALKELGRFEDAIEAYENSINLDENFSIPWSGKGFSLRELDKSDESMKSFNKAIELDENDSYPWYGKGLLFDKFERYEDMDRAFKRVCYLAKKKEILRFCHAILERFYHVRHAPFLLLRLVTEEPRLFVEAGWYKAVRDFEDIYSSPIELAFYALANDDAPRQLGLRSTGCLFFHMGDPIVAMSDFFDPMDDKFPEDLLGQYYLVSSLAEYFEDYSAALSDALETAGDYGGDDPEQLYYAARLCFLAEEDEQALRILNRAGDYAPALFFLFEAALENGDKASMMTLAGRLLDLESSAPPRRRFLRYHEKLVFDLEGTEWMEDVLHWAKQCELVPQIHTFLQELDRKPYYDLRARYSDVLLETYTGPMDLVRAWQLNEPSQHHVQQLFDKQKETILADLRVKLKAVHAFDISDFDEIHDSNLESTLAERIQENKMSIKATQLVIYYFYHQNRLSLSASFVLGAYAELFNKNSTNQEGLKRFFLDTFSNAVGNFAGFSLALLVTSFLLPISPILTTILGGALITSTVPFIIERRSKGDTDYQSFKDDLKIYLRKHCADIPDDFWEPLEH